MIHPRESWTWFGNAGHLCVASHCRFHLCTLVGQWLVSTVGEYVPDSAVREVLASARGAILQGRGDEREASWMKQVGFDEIGYGRKYETMVFEAGAPCVIVGCGCGLPAISGSSLDMDGYNDAGSATKGHYALCEKWADLTEAAPLTGTP